MERETIAELTNKLFRAFIEKTAASEIAPQPGTYASEIRSLASLQDDLISRPGGFDAGENLGWRNVEPLYRPARGQWTVVTGIPGHGKTSWVDSVMLNLVSRCGWKFGVFSAENQPIVRHAMWLLSKFTGQPWHKISSESVSYSLRIIGEFISILNPEENHLTLEYILELALALKLESGLDGLIIDPWNEVDHSGRFAGETETEYISRSLSQLRRFARKHNIHIWVVAHPMKLTRDKNGAYPVPSLYDISGSAAWRAKCDFGICVWRNMDNCMEPTRIIVQKVRYFENGKVGQARLSFEPSIGRYQDA